ncbi:MAG: dihydroorotate dehydrogenase [Chloroflexi bacterium]|nr:dihydroorotate dehydrogenase [Chloroflexota bacterium]
MDLRVQLAPKNRLGLTLGNPVMVASGTFGYGMEYAGVIDVQRLGAIVCKGTTLKPRPGNAEPRVAETASGMLNAIGLENPGVDALIRDIAPVWAEWRVPVIVNIAGESIDEYREVASRLDGVDGISGIEVNISCPNIEKGSVEFGTSPDLAAEVTEAVRNASSLPLMVKLTPNVTDIGVVAKAVVRAGADALTVCNTLRGMAVDIVRRRPVLGNICGGLSGPAIKPVALYLVYAVSKAVDVPIVGCGGISSATDAIEFIMAGASAVQVGTATFLDPRACLNILVGIEDFMARENILTLSEIVGQARA